MRGLTRHRVLRLSTNRQDDKTKHVTAKQLTQQLMHPPPSPLWSTGGRHWDATSTAWSDHATVPGAEPTSTAAVIASRCPRASPRTPAARLLDGKAIPRNNALRPQRTPERRHPEEQRDAVRWNRASLPQRFSEPRLCTMNDLVPHHAPLRAKRVPSAQECSRALRSKHVHVFRLELPRVRAEDKPGGAPLARPPSPPDASALASA